MSIILFDSGRSYAIRSEPVKEEEYRFTDNLGRTQADRDFLDQFESLFYAASEGDLARCQRIANEGFHDFNAVSFGRFGTPSGKRLDNISPLKIAEMRGHTEIVNLFNTIIMNKKLGFAGKRDKEESTTNIEITEEESIYYKHEMETFKSMPYDEVIKSIPSAIICTYSIVECIEKDLATLLSEMNKTQLVYALEERCTQPFTCSKRSEIINRARIKALIEFLKINSKDEIKTTSSEHQNNETAKQLTGKEINKIYDEYMNLLIARNPGIKELRYDIRCAVCNSYLDLEDYDLPQVLEKLAGIDKIDNLADLEKTLCERLNQIFSYQSPQKENIEMKALAEYIGLKRKLMENQQDELEIRCLSQWLIRSHENEDHSIEIIKQFLNDIPIECQKKVLQQLNIDFSNIIERMLGDDTDDNALLAYLENLPANIQLYNHCFHKVVQNQKPDQIIKIILDKTTRITIDDLYQVSGNASDGVIQSVFALCKDDFKDLDENKKEKVDRIVYNILYDKKYCDGTIKMLLTPIQKIKQRHLYETINEGFSDDVVSMVLDRVETTDDILCMDGIEVKLSPQITQKLIEKELATGSTSTLALDVAFKTKCSEKFILSVVNHLPHVNLRNLMTALQNQYPDDVIITLVNKQGVKQKLETAAKIAIQKGYSQKIIKLLQTTNNDSCTIM